MGDSVKIGGLCLELGDKFISITDSGGGYDHLEIEASEQNLRKLKTYFELLLKEAEGRCLHRNIRSAYDRILCEDCGSIMTDSGWGIASNRWFKSGSEAEFYRANGKLPDREV